MKPSAPKRNGPGARIALTACLAATLHGCQSQRDAQIEAFDKARMKQVAETSQEKPTPAPTPPQPPVDNRTFIESEGRARIEVNEEYIGETPIQVLIPPAEGPHPTIVRALPMDAGNYVQTKIFTYGQTIPKHIFFAMDLHAVKATDQ